MAATGILAQRNPSMLYPPSPYYAGEMAAKYYDRKDPKKAKELLKQAGYNGEKLVLQTNSNYPYMRDSILVLSEQLKEAGVNADVQVIDWMSNSNNLQTRHRQLERHRPPASAHRRCSARRNGRAPSTPSRTSTRTPVIDAAFDSPVQIGRPGGAARRPGSTSRTGCSTRPT